MRKDTILFSTSAWTGRTYLYFLFAFHIYMIQYYDIIYDTTYTTDIYIDIYGCDA